MLRAGASGYLLKDCAFEELVHAIRAVVVNRTYLSPKIADIMIKDFVRLFPKTEFSVFSVLTPRERQVLQLLSEGKTTKQIASHLQVSVKTVETYRQQIMDKLDIHSHSRTHQICHPRRTDLPRNLITKLPSALSNFEVKTQGIPDCLLI